MLCAIRRAAQKRLPTSGLRAHLAALADDAGWVVHAAAEGYLIRLKHVQHACAVMGGTRSGLHLNI